ncbi:MAG: hypothetical protein ACP5HU_03260 [Phycisphaerae bacterium]
MQAPLSKEIAFILAAALSAMTAGCGPEATEPAAIGHYLHSPESVSRLGRVVFVELGDRGGDEEFAQTMTDAISRSVRDRKLFHVDVLRRSEPVCRILPVDKRSALTYQEVMEMRRLLNCEAVLFGWVDRYSPYPHMETGIYLRLLDLNRGQVVWGVDHVWDTGDKSVERRIRDFYYAESADGLEPAEWRLALMSPRAFGRFVAFEIGRTLPNSESAEALDERVRREKRRRVLEEMGEKLEDL